MAVAGKSRRARLAKIDLPDFGLSVEEPVIDPRDYPRRFESLLQRMRGSKLDAVVIYADREHAANLSWVSGFDPRFEEALLIICPINPMGG